MTPHDQDLLDLVPSYALGELEGDELRRLEGHLDSGCELCARELRESVAALEALAETVEPVMPSETTRARVLRQLPGTAGSASAVWVRRAAVAAGIVLLVGLGALQLDTRRRLAELHAERQESGRQIALLRAELESARSELRLARRTQGIALSPASRGVVLAGLQPAPGAAGHAIVDAARGEAVFFGSGLPAAPAGRTYQLWHIGAAGPVSAGIFEADADGEAVLLVSGIEAPADIQTWAVTLEPAGGVPQPTGPMVLKS